MTMTLSPITSLSSREVEVLVILARGATNKEIADELFVSEKTVRNHVEHIYLKLDISNRVVATLYALAVGLVDLNRGA